MSSRPGPSAQRAGSGAPGSEAPAEATAPATSAEPAAPLDPSAAPGGSAAPGASAASRTPIVPAPAATPSPGGPVGRPPIVVATTSRARAARRPPVAAGQLDLALVPELPVISIEPEWKDQPRLWGHSLHPMCSYLASFPAALAHAFVARYTRPGDVVLDPFSGRGTTPLQACAEGRVGAGNDLNPFAHVLTAAKVDPPTGREVAIRMSELRIDYGRAALAWRALGDRVVAERPRLERDRLAAPKILVPGAASRARPDDGTETVPAEVSIAFHPVTLGQLLFVRSQLDLGDRTDRYLAAAVTGILHGKSRSYLSVLMPNTFSMAPGYVRAFAASAGFVAPERDAFACLSEKLARLARDPLPPVRGVALLGDARDAGARFRVALRERSLPDRARLVVTSPPYLRVVKYGYYNWLRTWFLGLSADQIDRDLDDAHHRAPYLVFLREVLAGLRVALADDAVVVLVIGDVEADRGRRIRNGVGLAEAAWEAAAEPEGYRLAGIALDPVAAPRKMTKLWGAEAGQATKTDRLLVLGATEAGRRRAIAGAGVPVSWPPAGPTPRLAYARR